MRPYLIAVSTSAAMAAGSRPSVWTVRVATSW
jgi:hypothetical protein